MGSIGELEINEFDVLIVGAGFGAATMLKKLLDKGFDVKVYEKGSSFGGLSSRNMLLVSRYSPVTSYRNLVLVSSVAFENPT